MVHIGTVDRVSDCAVKTVDMYMYKNKLGINILMTTKHLLFFVSLSENV